MASLRKAAQCIGLSGRISVVHDFFGFWTGKPQDHTLSLLRQVRLLRGKHFHLNVIRTAPFNKTLQARIDSALQEARDLYAPVGIGIGRIKHFKIPQGGYEIIMSEGVALDLFDSWSAPNDGIDAFFTYYLQGPPAGRSPEDGSCDKSGKDSGLLVGVLDSSKLGHTLAHEIGHFLGLGHEDDLSQNLMHPDVPRNDAPPATLYPGQVGVIRLHCSMHSGCQT